MMNENVTYKSLLFIVLGMIAFFLAFMGNAQSKFDQVSKNEKNIENININIERINIVIHENQIKVIEGQGEIKLLLTDKQDKE